MINFRRPGQDAAHFKTDKFGKLIIAEEEETEAASANAAQSVRSVLSRSTGFRLGVRVGG
jgi:hypothetical protein